MKHSIMTQRIILARTSLISAVLLVCVAQATPAWAQPPLRVAVVGAQMVHSDKLNVSQEFPAMLQALLDKDGAGKYSVVNCGDCCATVSLNYTASETHPYLKPGNNPQFLPGYPTAVKTMPNVVILGPFGKHDRELALGIKGKIMLTQEGFEKDYETMIMTFEAMPTHPKMFACLPIPIPFGMASGPVNDVILPAIKAVVARHPEITMVDTWAPFLGNKNLFQQDTGDRAGSHLTHPEGLMLLASTVYPVFKAAMDGTSNTSNDGGAAPGSGGGGGTDDAGTSAPNPGTGGTTPPPSTGGAAGTSTGGTSGSPPATGGTTGGGSPEPADAAATPVSTPPRKSGGCSYGSSGNCGLGMTLFVLVVLALRRRRRA
jgi:hypothetical protein